MYHHHFRSGNLIGQSTPNFPHSIFQKNPKENQRIKTLPDFHSPNNEYYRRNTNQASLKKLPLSPRPMNRLSINSISTSKFAFFGFFIAFLALFLYFLPFFVDFLVHGSTFQGGFHQQNLLSPRTSCNSFTNAFKKNFMNLNSKPIMLFFF